MGGTAAKPGTAPLKRIAQIMVSNVDKKAADGERAVRLCNYVDVYKHDSITDDLPFMDATATMDQIARFTLQSGDVVITKDSESPDDIGVPAYVPHDLPGVVCGYHLAVLRPRGGVVDGRYLHWAISSASVSGQLHALALGITRFGLRQSAVGQIQVPLPPAAQQPVIADFLDREVSRIDALIRAKKHLATLLRERLSSLVLSLTVDRYSAEGVPAATDFQPSSRAKRVRRLMRKLDRPIRLDDEVVTAFRDGEVNIRSARRSDGYTFSEIEDQYQGVEVGDIVFHGLDGFAGAVGVAAARGKCTPVYHVCEALEGNDARFLALTLRSLGIIGFLAVQSGNVRERAVDFRTWRALGRVPLPAPELVVQTAIADEAVKAVQNEGQLRSLLQRQISRLEEYRLALVTSVIDGPLELPAGV